MGTEAGLKIFEEITFLDEYYLTNAEIQALERHAKIWLFLVDRPWLQNTYD